MTTAEMNRNSFFLNFAKRSFSSCLALEASVNKAWYNSRTRKAAFKLSATIRAYLKGSFIGRFSQINNETYVPFLEKSRVFQYMKRECRKISSVLIFALSYSRLKEQYSQFQKDFLIFPLRILGLAIISAVITNLALSLMLKNEINLPVFLIQGLFLLIGACALQSKVSLPALKNSSFTLTLIRKKYVRNLR